MTEIETRTESQFTSNSSYIHLTSLHPYYSYTFKIAAVTVAEGPFSNDYTVLMPEDGKTLYYTAWDHVCFIYTTLVVLFFTFVII